MSQQEHARKRQRKKFEEKNEIFRRYGKLFSSLSVMIRIYVFRSLFAVSNVGKA